MQIAKISMPFGVTMGETKPGTVFKWRGQLWMAVLGGHDQLRAASLADGELISLEAEDTVLPVKGAFVPGYTGEAE